LSPILATGKIRFVLSWLEAPRDLDIHLMIKTGKFSKCEVFFAKPECSGAILDANNYLGGTKGVETVTINTLGNFNYSIVAHKYTKNPDSEDKNIIDDAPVLLPEEENFNNIPDIDFKYSKAKISVYVPGFKRAIKDIYIPDFTNEKTIINYKDDIVGNYDWWLGFCLDGKLGLNSLLTVNKFTVKRPEYSTCEDQYKINKKG